MLRSALLVLSGNAAAAIMGLARNLAVASLIPVADYGIAATFAVVTAVIEMATAFGLQQQIIQAKDGDDPALQAGLQGFQLMRGVIASVLLFLLAAPMADFLRVPEVAWAYQVMAVTPMLTALQHFDMHRLTRKGRFGPMVLSGTLPAALSLAAIWPLAAWFGDFRVMLFAIIAQAVATAILSHLTAERAYRASLDRVVIRRGLGFGWPLMLNNILLFGVFNGDKLIVGRELGLEALAILAMGLTLTLPPTLVLARSLQNLFLPRLSLSRGDPAKFAALAAGTIQAVVMLSLGLVAVIALAGRPAVFLILGQDYAPLLPLLTWFAILQGLRVLKAGPAIVALSVGEPGNALAANLPRILSLPVAWLAVVSGGGLLEVVLIGVAGEAAGLVVSFAMLRLRSGVRVQRLSLPLVAALVLFFGAGVEAMLQSDPAAGFGPPWLVGLAVLTLGGAAWASRDLRRGFGGV